MSDEGIYQTPDSNLVTNGVPESFYSGALSASALNWAGWLSIFYALLTIPMILLLFIGEVFGHELSIQASYAVRVLSLGLWTYILIILNRFVVLRFNLTSLRNYIILLVGLSIVMLIFSFFRDQSEDVKSLSAVSIVYYSLTIPFGVVEIFLGRKLLSVVEPYPYLKVLAWARIVAGICSVSVVFFLIVLPAELVADVFLALFFFRGRRELMEAASN
ncbi:MAG: hypothetical protein COB04_05740 [Gammaproteobacteria bacterium]|nr:MAG: hypothetical protein COB04_05740 [Gammaproteobacteria bacterium]